MALELTSAIPFWVTRRVAKGVTALYCLDCEQFRFVQLSVPQPTNASKFCHVENLVRISNYVQACSNVFCVSVDFHSVAITV